MKIGMSLAVLVDDGRDRLRLIGVEPTGVLMNPRTLREIENEIAEMRQTMPDPKGRRTQTPTICGLPIKTRHDIAPGDALVVSADDWRRYGG